MTIYQCNAFNSIKTQKITFSLIFRKSLKMISLKFKRSFEFPFKLHSTFMSKHSFKSMNKTLSINLMNVFLVEIEWLFILKYFRENGRTNHKKCISFHFNGKKNIFYPSLFTHLLHKLWPTHTYRHFCFSYGNHFNLSHTSVSIVVFIFNFLSIYNHCWYNEPKEFSFHANLFEWAIWNIVLLFKQEEEKRNIARNIKLFVIHV